MVNEAEASERGTCFDPSTTLLLQAKIRTKKNGFQVPVLDL
jgi:hypothetical protein